MKIGETTTDKTLVGKRDAMHVPVVLVRSTQKLNPCDTVRFTDKKFSVVETCRGEEAHAIVDPFLESVHDYFWVLLKPGIVADLRHEFEMSIEKVEEEEKEKIEEEEEEYDNSCSGCYGHDITPEEDDGCRGCY